MTTTTLKRPFLVAQLVRERGTLTRAELAEILGVSKSTAGNHLAAASDLGLIRWDGAVWRPSAEINDGAQR